MTEVGVVVADVHPLGAIHVNHRLKVVSHGQTLFRTEGKGLGHGHRAVCRPTPWSANQSQHSIQSHDTWSMWLTGKFKFQFA